MTRNGKIARLPKAIRETINRDLEDGVSGSKLVALLNGMPEVQAILKEHFGGAEIREQNLSEWKKGGFAEWRRHQEAMALAERLYERAEEMKQKGVEQMPMSEVLSLWVAARYAVVTEEIAAMEGEEGRKQLHQLCGNVARLRRLDQQALRLEQHAQALKLEEQKVAAQTEAVAIERERWEFEYAEATADEVEMPEPECDWEAEVDEQEYQEFQLWFREQTDAKRIDWVRNRRNWVRIRPRTEKERKQIEAEVFGRA